MNFTRVVGVAALVYTLGCQGVSVSPSGNNVQTTSKATECSIEFFRTTKPDRPYVEIATLSYPDGPGDLPAFKEQEKIREKACELGADAVIVTREAARPTHLMIGVAIKYK